MKNRLDEATQTSHASPVEPEPDHTRPAAPSAAPNPETSVVTCPYGSNSANSAPSTSQSPSVSQPGAVANLVRQFEVLSLSLF